MKTFRTILVVHDRNGDMFDEMLYDSSGSDPDSGAAASGLDGKEHVELHLLR